MLEDVGEINEILGRSYGLPDGVDEADLDAELAFLGDELEAEPMPTESISAGPSSVAEAPSSVFNTLPSPGYASTLPAAASTAPANRVAQANASSNFNLI
jgi:charged multivesicular body protein 5